MRLLAAAAIALALAACSGAPRKSGPPPATTAAPPPAEGAQRPRKSPYAPAQEDPSKRGDYVAGGLYAPHIRDSAPDYIPDVDAIPEPEVVDEPRSRYGNRSPYTVLGKRYFVLDDAEGFVEQGLASFYGNKFHGRRTSNMEVYDMYAFTAAHKSLPLPSFARVTNLDNGRSVVVRVNDRGPFHEGRVVDLSWAAAVKLDMHRQGTAPVEVRALSPGEHARHDWEAVAQEPAAPQPSPVPDAPRPSAIDALIDILPISSVAAGERPAPAAGPPAQPAPAAEDARDTASRRPEIAEGVDPQYAHERRFSMMQDGRVMTADDFDAWLKERQIDLHAGGALARAAAAAPADPAQPRDGQAPNPAAAPSSTPAARSAAAQPPAADAVTLQVAAFGARDNAERALAMLQGAGVDGAKLVNGVSAGRSVWRVQVGPVASAMVAELSARFAGLGFGQPQVVRD